MTERDRLIELYNESDNDCNNRDCDSCKYWGTPNYMMVKFIDKILANGIIVPLVKVGDTLYVILNNTVIAPVSVTRIKSENYSNFVRKRIYVIGGNVEHEYDFNDIGKTVFLNHEEAEKVLKERTNNEPRRD